MTDLTTLIEEIEQAAEGSRDLSGRIAKAMVWPDVPLRTCVAAAPEFTTSLDAALSLVPEGCISWTITDSPGGPTATVYDGEREYRGIPFPGKGTPALALCAAVLRAMEVERDG